MATKKTAKKKAAKPTKGFEETLWETATKLRGSVESSDWIGATETTCQGYPEGERRAAPSPKPQDPGPPRGKLTPMHKHHQTISRDLSCGF